MEKVVINDVSYEGEGVGRIDGKVVFVPYTLKDEIVLIEKIKENNKFIKGKIISIENKSKNRIEAICPFYSICGGCNYQHTTRENELEIKKNNLEKELTKIGYNNNIKTNICDKRSGYRNKIKLKVKNFKLGYINSNENKFVEINKCFLIDDDMNILLNQVQSFIENEKIKEIESVTIRGQKQSYLVCFHLKDKIKIIENTLKKYIKTDKIGVFCEYFDKNKRNLEYIFGLKNLDYEYENLKCSIDIDSFLQVNNDVANALYKNVLENICEENVINAYSGTGVLTAMISKTANKVYGIEMQKSSHLKAEELKKENNIENMFNILGKCEDKFSEVLEKEKISSIVLDPARAGCHQKVLEKILESNVKKIVYVSCNPSTLTRDLKVLTKSYDVQNVEIFDMFPCTANIEVFCVLKKI